MAAIQSIITPSRFGGPAVVVEINGKAIEAPRQ